MRARRCLCVAALLLSLAAWVAGEHETVLCDWLAPQSYTHLVYCLLGFDSCEFPGVTCVVEDGTTYYEIDLTEEGLTGPLPEDLSDIVTLKTLKLDGNSFDGTLPSAWSALVNLVGLFLYNNSISGTLPTSWSALTALEELDLRHNELTGTLPTAWASMAAMKRMKLGHNDLTGGLPSEWSAWTDVRRVILDNNALSGTLPSSWSVFSELHRMDLSYNQLSSIIPESWSALSEVSDSLVFDGNADLICNAPSTWPQNQYSCIGTLSESTDEPAADDIAPEPETALDSFPSSAEASSAATSEPELPPQTHNDEAIESAAPASGPNSISEAASPSEVSVEPVGYPPAESTGSQSEPSTESEDVSAAESTESQIEPATETEDESPQEPADSQVEPATASDGFPSAEPIELQTDPEPESERMPLAGPMEHQIDSEIAPEMTAAGETSFKAIDIEDEISDSLVEPETWDMEPQGEGTESRPSVTPGQTEGSIIPWGRSSEAPEVAPTTQMDYTPGQNDDIGHSASASSEDEESDTDFLIEAQQLEELFWSPASAPSVEELPLEPAAMDGIPLQGIELPPDEMGPLPASTEDPPESEAPAAAPEPATLVEEASTNFCSSAAIECITELPRVYEKVQVGTVYSLSPDLSERTVYGIKSLDTAVPTRPSDPHTIVIPSEGDACGSVSNTVLEIHISCPENQFYCETEDERFCSLAELCLNLNAAEDNLDQYDGESIAQEPPTIQLAGLEQPQISVGDSYAACQKCSGESSDVLCDAGAEAWDSVEGNLAKWVEACSTTTETFYFEEVGLAGCRLNTSTPGIHDITFTVRDSIRQVASVTRQLLVLPNCADGEFVCEEVLQCSVAGSCFLYTGRVPEAEEVDLDSLGEPSAVQNNTLELILTPATPQTVNVTIGRTYDKCEAGIEPTEHAKCEPGVAVQIYPDQGTEYEIYACPSSPCRYAGGQKFCQDSMFSERGLLACNFDTSAPPGTRYEIQFMAVPTNASLPTLYARRFLLLESVCGEGQYQCDDVCSPIPCDRYSAILYDAKPVIRSRFPDGVSLAYGVASGVSVLPCGSSECAVEASDEEDGDLTADVRVVETTPCEGERAACRFCDPVYVSSGECLPGIYRYEYFVEDTGGNMADRVILDVNIVEISEFTVLFVHTDDETSIESEQFAKNVVALKGRLSIAIARRLDADSIDSEISGAGFASTYFDDLVRLQTSLIGVPGRVQNAKIYIADDLRSGDVARAVPAFFRTSAEGQSSGSRRLLQSVEGESLDLESAAGESLDAIAALDVSELNFVLNGSRSSLLTAEVDYTLGAILSVLGELEALYQESVYQVASLVETVRASYPDTAETERQLTSSVWNLVLDKTELDRMVTDRLNSTDSFDRLSSRVEDMLNAAGSAVKETVAMMNAQLEGMNRMRNYQGFLEEMQSMGERDACIDNAPERRYAFSIPVEDSDEAPSRKLLQARRSVGTTAGISAGDQFASEGSGNDWGAYALSIPAIDAPVPSDSDVATETMLRGATNDRNFVVGGVVIETERSTKRQICYGRFAHLVDYCYAIPLREKDASRIPYGRDPVFLVDSALYDEDAVVRKEKYYDTRRETALSSSGIPFGFQPREIEGTLGTHYAYLDVQFGRLTAAKMMQYLNEGQFLDGMTDSVVLRFVTYNPQFSSAVFAVNEIRCDWKQSIDCKHRIDALPDVRWSDPIAGTSTAVISLLVLVYWTVIVTRVVRQRKDGVPLGTCLADGLGDLIAASAMAAALCTSIALSVYDVSDLGPRMRFDVYDTSRFYGANWLLPKRQNAAGDEPVPLGRWMLPENATDVHRLANFLQSVESYRKLASICNVLQTAALLAIILRLLGVASAIPRVSVITCTLKQCIVPLLYFLLPFGIVLVHFAVMATVCFGRRVEALSDVSRSMRTVMEFVFFGAGDLLTELTPEGVALHPMERVMAITFKVSLACLSVFIFINFVLAILTDAFLYEKSRLGDQKTGASTSSCSFGAAIAAEVNSVVRKKKVRSRRVAMSVSDIGRHNLKALGLDRGVVRTRSLIGAKSILPVREPETIETTTTCMNAARSVSAHEKPSIAASLRRIDEALLREKGSSMEKSKIESLIQRVEEHVCELLHTYEAARLFAIQSRLELLQYVSEK